MPAQAAHTWGAAGAQACCAGCFLWTPVIWLDYCKYCVLKMIFAPVPACPGNMDAIVPPHLPEGGRATAVLRARTP